MNTYRNDCFIKLSSPTAVGLGNFDGVHLGHQKLLSILKGLSIKKNLKSVVLTFDPHPSKVLNPQKADPLIMTSNQKESIIRLFGMDYLVFSPLIFELKPSSNFAFLPEIISSGIFNTCMARV
jgi:riboflavin kinase/FMN adenylyltransferase